MRFSEYWSYCIECNVRGMAKKQTIYRRFPTGSLEEVKQIMTEKGALNVKVTRCEPKGAYRRG